MRPRGESISSPQSTYVGHDGKQNPQWTHLSISAGSGGSCPSNALLPRLDAVPAALSITGFTEQHLTALVLNTLQRQFQARWSVSSVKADLAPRSTLRPDRAPASPTRTPGRDRP